ncbi:MAG: AAA family ATPase [Patescibacteria group bacterium]
MKPIICLVTGPAGVGKSTITKELAKKFINSARVDVDYIRKMIVSGYVKPFRDSKKIRAQLLLSRKNACSIAKNFIESGFCVFIDDVILKESSLDYYLESLSDYKVFVFLLFCNKDVLRKRDTARPKGQVMGKRALQLHDDFSKRLDEKRWFVIDTSKSTVAKTTKQIIGLIKKNF